MIPGGLSPQERGASEERSSHGVGRNGPGDVRAEEGGRREGGKEARDSARGKERRAGAR